MSYKELEDLRKQKEEIQDRINELEQEEVMKVRQMYPTGATVQVTVMGKITAVEPDFRDVESEGYVIRPEKLKVKVAIEGLYLHTELLLEQQQVRVMTDETIDPRRVKRAQS